MFNLTVEIPSDSDLIVLLPCELGDFSDEFNTLAEVRAVAASIVSELSEISPAKINFMVEGENDFELTFSGAEI